MQTLKGSTARLPVRAARTGRVAVRAQATQTTTAEKDGFKMMRDGVKVRPELPLSHSE
jgi:hypothetical protein